MVFNINLRETLLIFAIVLAISLIIYTRVKGRRNPTFNSYLFSQILILIWSTCQLLRMFTTNYQTQWYIVCIEYFSICFIGLSWLIFCLRYTESTILHRRFTVILLCLPPLICYLFVFSNPYHHLFFQKSDIDFSKYEIIFWVHTVFSYLYCLVGTVLLIRYSFKQFEYLKKQAIILVFAFLIPFIANAAMIFGIFNPGFDVTPPSFTIALLLLAIAIFKYKLLNIVPIALRKIVNNMKESIMVTDKLNRIEEYNPALLAVFPELSAVKIGDDIGSFIDNIQVRAEITDDNYRIIQAMADGKSLNISGELNLDQPFKQSFYVNIQPVVTGKEIIGRVISFNDITEYKNLGEELRQKNIELSIKNQQLEKYAATVEELAITKERNRFARDVHDTLGQTMTLLISLLQISKNDCRTNPEKAGLKINEAIKIASTGLTEVRRSLIGLASESLVSEGLNQTLQNLITDFQTSGVQINLAINGLEQYQNPIYTDVIYRICQEALTNSIRHGKAKIVNISLDFVNHSLKLTIADNGIGCSRLNKGMGLTGMEQRIYDLNGTISYNSNQNGFIIQVEFPMKNER